MLTDGRTDGRRTDDGVTGIRGMSVKFMYKSYLGLISA